MKSVQHTATMTTCSSVLQLKGHFTKIGRRGCYSRKGKRKMLWFVDYFSQYDLEMLQKFLLYSVKLQWESYGCDRTVSFKFVSLFDRLQLRWSIYNIIILHFNWNLFFFFEKWLMQCEESSHIKYPTKCRNQGIVSSPNKKNSGFITHFLCLARNNSRTTQGQHKKVISSVRQKLFYSSSSVRVLLPCLSFSSTWAGLQMSPALWCRTLALFPWHFCSRLMWCCWTSPGQQCPLMKWTKPKGN